MVSHLLPTLDLLLPSMLFDLFQILTALQDPLRWSVRQIEWVWNDRCEGG